MWEDERPIQPMRGGGAAKLDSESQFQYGYDRKRNPLEALASGDTPPRSTLEPNTNYLHQGEFQSSSHRGGDALDHEVHNSGSKFVAKKYVPPAEHFSFSPER